MFQSLDKRLIKNLDHFLETHCRESPFPGEARGESEKGLLALILPYPREYSDAQTTLAGEVEQLKTANAKLEEELTHLRTLARKYGVPESSLQR